MIPSLLYSFLFLFLSILTYTLMTLSAEGLHVTLFVYKLFFSFLFFYIMLYLGRITGGIWVVNLPISRRQLHFWTCYIYPDIQKLLSLISYLFLL